MLLDTGSTLFDAVRLLTDFSDPAAPGHRFDSVRIALGVRDQEKSSSGLRDEVDRNRSEAVAREIRFRSCWVIRRCDPARMQSCRRSRDRPGMRVEHHGASLATHPSAAKYPRKHPMRYAAIVERRALLDDAGDRHLDERLRSLHESRGGSLTVRMSSGNHFTSSAFSRRGDPTAAVTEAVPSP